MTIRKVQDGSRVNRPLNQLHPSITQPGCWPCWLDLLQAGSSSEQCFWATVKFTETSVTEKERDCGTDYAELGQESWGSSRPLLLLSGEFILSLLLSTCKLTSQQALGWLTRLSASAAGRLLAHSWKNSGSVEHSPWADLPWNFTPGKLLINLKDQFVESPAGCAVHGPPTIYMKTNWHLHIIFLFSHHFLQSFPVPNKIC